MHSEAVEAALLDIRHNIRLADNFVSGSDLATFRSDLKTFYATTRCLEIISEASRRLPTELKARHAGIEWQKIAGAGNIYRHSYDNVAQHLVWETVHGALPALRAVVDEELTLDPEPPKPRMAHLFTPLKLGSLELANRIVIAPMCQYSAQDGAATDWHMIHLGHLALSGAGMMILEATAVSARGRISPQDLGLYSDDDEAALARVIKAVRAYSPIALAIQLSHAGRKGSSRPPWEGGAQIRPDEPGGWKTEAPSPVPHAPDEVPPDALDHAGLARVRDEFVAAAQRAARLGFEGIEIHGAHGYLLHQFLSPIANKRTDEYGGSLENRMRFPLEVYDAVRAAFPAAKPVWMRISATDWVPNGWDIEGTIAFSKALQERGCAAIHVTTGGVSPQQAIKVGPGYQVPYAQRVKAEVGLPTIAVGLITEPEQAEMIIANGEADAVSLARAMLYDPRWPWHAAAKLGAHVSAPKQYWRSQPRAYSDLFENTSYGQR